MADLNELKPVGKLNPFAKFCCTIGNLPTSYMISLTYEEQLLWLCKYLEDTVIPAVNTNAEAVQELQELYVVLKNYVDNYFENLDVQEEINNKLDEMVEDGTLQEIIADYLNTKAIFGYNNVASMKNATNLINGSYARTLGYYTKNDDGGALYKIRTITNDDVIDNMFIIAMENNTLIAELITTNVNIKQLGAIENEDITNIVETSLNKIGYVNLTKGKFKANISITNDNFYQIIGNDTTLVPYNSEVPVIEIYCNEIEKEKIIKNIKLELTNSENGIKIHKPETSRRDTYLPQRINIENVYVYVTDNFTGTAFDFKYISEINVNNINVKREKIQDNTRSGKGLQITSCINFNVLNSSFGFLDKAINIDTNNKSCEGITINNCEMLFNNYGVYALSSTSYNVLSLRVSNCMIDQIQKAGVVYDGIMASSIINNWFGANVTNTDCILLQSSNLDLFQTIIENNMMWLNNKTNSYHIRISRNNTYNIIGVDISNNTFYNHNQKSIYIDNTNSISNININNNYFSTNSNDASNTPLSYNAVPNNCMISNCNNGGSPLKITDDIIIKNCIGIINSKIFTSDDITLGSTQQNTSNNTLVLCITGTASGNRGYIGAFIGFTQSQLTLRYTQAIESGSQGVVYVTIPPKGWYNITTTSAVTINSIYGYYQN